MSKQSTSHPSSKSRLHPRSKHRERYNFLELFTASPDLREYVIINPYGDESIDFFDAESVKALNTALLKYFYKISFWEIPEGYLCPPVPGRADYLHYMADLLAQANDGKIPTGIEVRCLDIGVGANCIYPLIGHQEYGWSFVGSETDLIAIQAARKIIDSNGSLKDAIEIRLQRNPKGIFAGIINEGENFDVTICNPPFHASEEEAYDAAVRKVSNLKKQKVDRPELNFGGSGNELWCEGGEEKFVRDMILQSKQFATSVKWFSTLISKSENLEKMYDQLEQVGATKILKTPMGTGNKITRIVAWTFLKQ